MAEHTTYMKILKILFLEISMDHMEQSVVVIISVVDITHKMCL